MGIIQTEQAELQSPLINKRLTSPNQLGKAHVTLFSPAFFSSQMSNISGLYVGGSSIQACLCLLSGSSSFWLCGRPQMKNRGWMLHLLLKPQSFAKCRPQNSIRISWWWGTIHLFHTLSLLPQETALHPLPFATLASQTVFFILEYNQDMSSGKMHLMVHPRVEESACLKVIFIPQED